MVLLVGVEGGDDAGAIEPDDARWVAIELGRGETSDAEIEDATRGRMAGGFFFFQVHEPWSPAVGGRPVGRNRKVASEKS